MIIQKLQFHPFGPFEDKTINFSNSAAGLHIIYGHNEAGKSSSLRAITDLLFGFQHITPDNWRYENKSLRISADLQVEDGQKLTLSRYKRRNNDLLNYLTEEVVEQQFLSKFLGNIDRETFLHTFGISHDSLRLGVESILAAGGDLGHALFTASSGLNSLTRLIQSLEEQQSALFTPRAQKAAINANISKIKELKKLQNQVSSSHEEWKKLNSSVDDLSKEEQTLLENLDRSSESLIQKNRHYQGFKYYPKYQELLEKLAELGELPALDHNFREERISAQTTLKEVGQQLEFLTLEQKKVSGKLQKIIFDQIILSGQLQIETLATEAAVHIKAQNDGKSIVARVNLLKDTVTKQLSHIQPGLTIEKVKDLNITLRSQQQIQQLHTEYIKLTQSQETTRQALEVNRISAAKLQQELESISLPEENSKLLLALEESQEHGALEQRLREVNRNNEILKRQVAVQLSALKLWDGSLKELLELAIPGPETIRIFQDNYTEYKNSLRMVNQRINDCEIQLQDKQQALNMLVTSDSVITREHLDQQRKIRELGWTSIKQCWLENKEPNQTFLEQFPDAEDLSSAFELSISRTDQTADTLLQNAEKIAVIENHKNTIGILEQQNVTLQQQRQSISEKHEEERRKWHQLWASCHITPLTPAEMSDWYKQLQDLRSSALELHKTEIELKELESLHTRLLELLSLHLNISEHKSNQQNLKQLMGLAKQRIEQSKKLHSHNEQLQNELSRLLQEQDVIHNNLENISRKKKNWQNKWLEKTFHFGFSAEDSIEEVVAFIGDILDVNQQIEKINELQIRHRAIENDYATYTDQVKTLFSQLQLPISDILPEQAAVQLHGQLKKNQELQEQFNILKEKEQKNATLIAEAEQKSASLKERLTILCEHAGVSSVELLSKVEQDVIRKQQLENELVTLYAQISEYTGGQSLGEYFKQIQDLNPDKLKVEIEHLQEKQKDLKERHRQVVEDLALTRQELNSFSSESEAVDLAAQIESLKASTELDVQRYITLKAGSAILSKSVEQYRKNNQNPVLKLASSYFSDLTGGAFTAIRADFDEKGSPIIKAEKPDQSRLAIQQLSDGSRDQLFLSLRLGSLARHVKNNGPMPFIVDDILVHFDDSRAYAALEAMQKLGKQSQIIFFTHHEHLLELVKTSPLSKNIELHYL